MKPPAAPASGFRAATRIEKVSAALFGPARDGERVADVVKLLRYQLATALAGALIEARTHGCGQAVLIVHEFVSRPDQTRGIEGTSPAKVRRNALALESFVKALAADTETLLPGSLLGPIRVAGAGRIPRDLPVLIGKATRTLDDRATQRER